MAKILVVEDDRSMSLDLKQWLEQENYVVETAYDGLTAADLLKVYSYDAVVLDWELPGMAGIDVLRQFRRGGGLTPVLLLTGRSQLEDKECGLDTGADDYLAKPFQFRELAARLRALLRRSTGQTENLLKVGDLVLDPQLKRVTGGGSEINLLPKEFALMEFFMRHADQAFSGEALLSRVWSSESEASMNTVKTYIYMLRKKLTSHGYSNLIQTAHGYGYKLASQEARKQTV